MPITLACILNSLELLHEETPGLNLNGANLATAGALRLLAAHPRVERIEAYVAVSAFLDQKRLRAASASLRPLGAADKVDFLPLPAVAERWRDGRPRVLFSTDPSMVQRDRYLRDRFAEGPMPLTVDTHTIGAQHYWGTLGRFARAVPVPFDSVVCISTAYARAFELWLRHAAGAPDAPLPCRIDVQPHGIDTSLFHPVSPEHKRAIRRTLRLPEHDLLSVSLGRSTPNDKADLLPLLHWFATARTPGHTLVLAGEENAPGYTAALEKRAASLGIADDVIVRGRIEPSLRHLVHQAADIFVFPGDSIIEALANTALEAMACGVPVLTSDWDGIKDTVVDGVTGYRIPTRWMPALDAVEALSPAGTQKTDFLHVGQSVWLDGEAWTERWRELASDAALRARLGAAGVERVRTRFRWEGVIESWLQRWEDLLVLAQAESPEARTLRRARASDLCTPTPYTAVFSGYATRTWNLDEDRVRLSSRGWDILSGAAHLNFYDELLPSLNQATVDRVFTVLSGAGPEGITLRALAEATQAATGRGGADALFHTGLLLKSGLIVPVRTALTAAL